MRQITRQQKSEEQSTQQLIQQCSSQEEGLIIAQKHKDGVSQINAQSVGGLIITQHPNIRNQQNNFESMDQNLDQIVVDKFGSSQYSHKCSIVSKNNHIQMVRPPKNLAQFQICSTIGLHARSNIKTDIKLDQRLCTNAEAQSSQDKAAPKKSNLKLFSTKTSPQKRTRALLKDMVAAPAPPSPMKVTKFMPSILKRSQLLQPNLQVLDKIPHAKKISKLKLDLGRIKTKKILTMIQKNPVAYFSSISEPKASAEKSIEIPSNSGNVVVSHIENFVIKKNKKELYKKQLSSMKRQLLRNSVIRQKKVMASNPVNKKQITIQEKSFLDVTSLWTDQNQQKDEHLSVQRIAEQQSESQSATFSQNREDCFSLSSSSESGQFLSQSQGSEISVNEGEKDDIEQTISEYQIATQKIATSKKVQESQCSEDVQSQNQLRQVDHFSPSVAINLSKLEADVEAFDTVQQKKNGYFHAQFQQNSTVGSSIDTAAKRKLNFIEEIPITNTEIEHQWSDDEDPFSLNLDPKF